MKENQRTLAYVAVAGLALLIAFEPWNRGNALPTHVEQTGKLFPNFKDPQAASSMSIMKYDESTGTLHPFQVAKTGGIWSIPSHQNYPADARKHLAQAATTLMDLDILGTASTKPGDHELYGVLDPDPKTVGPGATGVGTRVTMKDAKDNVLADLIIGKADKDQPQVRYVRKADQDQVYRVLVQTDKLSTKFGDWIEKDLLKLNPLDIVSVQLNDYSTDLTLTNRGQPAVDRDIRSQIVVDYNDAKNAWTLARLIEYVDRKPVEEKLKENEELNVEKLNGMKSALDDLQIVDVERKPPGMKELRFSPDMPRDQLITQMQSLGQRGFYPVADKDGSLELLSSEGEALVNLKDGTQYVLRFGGVAANSEAEGEKEEAKKEGGDKKGSRLNRYLFLMAQFDPDLIPKPKLEELPSEEGADEPKAEGDDKAEGDKKPADDEKAEGDKPKADAAKADDAKSKDQQAAEEEAAAHKKAIAEKRAAIELANKRKQDEYDEKIKKGEEHVKELNERFADWYYVISDEVYHKIHLGQSDVIKVKAAPPGEGDSSADFKELEKKGLPKIGK